MFDGRTDREWEKYGRDEPYFGVLAEDRFRGTRLAGEKKKEFFESGRACVDDVLNKVRRKIDPDFSVRRALDFGCGVGRLTIPLAAIAGEVTGADVAESMLEEAGRNCKSRGLDNVVLVQTDDTLSSLAGEYDFILSFIVFQHIPVKRGERIFRNLLSRLAAGGVGVVHFTYARDHRKRRGAGLIKRYFPPAAGLVNLLRGRKFSAPRMEMNIYNLNKLLTIMWKSRIRDFHAEYTDHGGELGVILYFRKPEDAI